MHDGFWSFKAVKGSVGMSAYVRKIVRVCSWMSLKSNLSGLEISPVQPAGHSTLSIFPFLPDQIFHSFGDSEICWQTYFMQVRNVHWRTRVSKMLGRVSPLPCIKESKLERADF